MKKKRLTLLAIISVLFLNACFSPLSNIESKLTIRFDNSTRSLVNMDNEEYANFTHRVYLKSGSDEYIYAGEFRGASGSISISAGSYSVLVKAYDSGNKLRARGVSEETVTITLGQNKSVTIEMISTVEISNWAGLSDAIEAANEDIDRELYVYITGDITAVEDDETITSLGTVTLFAETNITINNVTFVISGGKFAMNDGITLKGSKKNSEAGGVIVKESGTFEMNGGAITEYHTRSGSGVRVEVGGTFNMKSGEIFGNEAIGFQGSSFGGGVYIDGGTFRRIGGTIYGYTEGETKSNVVKEISYNNNEEVTIAISRGHAVYAKDFSSNETRFKDTTVNTNLTFECDSDGGLKNAEGTWDNDDPGPQQPTDLVEFLKWVGEQTGTEFIYPMPENTTVEIDAYNLTEKFMNKTITLQGTPGGNQTIKLLDNGSLFTIGSSVTLILENITLEGHKDNDEVLVFIEEGTLIMNNGAKIADNNDGGVYVGGGTFIMHGGEISGNTALKNGGGVVIFEGTFTMTGGTITGNHAIETGGGVGVFYGNSGTTFTVGGTAKIFGNTSGSNNTDDNVFLNMNTLITLDTEYPPEEGMNIHVSTWSDHDNIIVASGALPEHTKYFKADMEGKLVAFREHESNGQLIIKDPDPNIQITLEIDGGIIPGGVVLVNDQSTTIDEDIELKATGSLTITVQAGFTNVMWMLNTQLVQTGGNSYTINTENCVHGVRNQLMVMVWVGTVPFSVEIYFIVEEEQ